MSITVVNRHAYKGNGTYIGRGGVFGNPYTDLPLEETKAQFQVSSREEAIERYKEWALVQLKENTYFRLAVYSLARKHAKGEEVVLACSCVPKPCHGNFIKQMLEDLVEFGIVTSDSEHADSEGDLPF